MEQVEGTDMRAADAAHIWTMQGMSSRSSGVNQHSDKCSHTSCRTQPNGEGEGLLHNICCLALGSDFSTTSLWTCVRYGYAPRYYFE